MIIDKSGKKLTKMEKMDLIILLSSLVFFQEQVILFFYLKQALFKKVSREVKILVLDLLKGIKIGLLMLLIWKKLLFLIMEELV